jgi:hypothetical protein
MATKIIAGTIILQVNDGDIVLPEFLNDGDIVLPDR